MEGIMRDGLDIWNREWDRVWRIYQSLHEAFHIRIIRLAPLKTRNLHHGHRNWASRHLMSFGSHSVRISNDSEPTCGLKKTPRPTYVFKSEVYNAPFSLIPSLLSIPTHGCPIQYMYGSSQGIS